MSRLGDVLRDVNVDIPICVKARGLARLQGAVENVAEV